ncbi:MAG TPA: putative sugar nucleotidyl transferase, partial [Gemmatimonadaceae bacterium]|nr:putative sugar nucleotidyl transferase [Gemmatimonadaceae bacterium]
MSALYFYDDVRARQFEPFALTRPACELRAGSSVIRRRWERMTGLKSAGFISSPHLSHFEEDDAPPAVDPKSEIPAGSVIVNTRCILPLDSEVDRFDLLMCEGSACAVKLARGLPASQFADGAVDLGAIQTSLGGRKVKGRWINEIWELVGTLVEQLTEDIPLRAKSLSRIAKHQAEVMGDHPIFVEDGADIGPQVVLDATDGPILVRKGAVIRPFTYLVGPISVGRGTQIMGARVAASSLG